MNSRFDYTILNAIENAVRTVKAAPLLLGSTSTGSGGPVGGFVGYLPQNKVSYDQDELAYSGLPYSGISLTDNLAHIRYRLDAVESGGGGGGASSFLDLNDTPTTYSGQVGKALVVNLTEDGLEFDSIGGTPAGGTNAVQINVGGVFAADNEFEYTVGGQIVTLGGKAATVEGSHYLSWSDIGVAFHNIASWGAGYYSSIRGIMARGTKASPTAAQANDVAMRFRGSAYDGVGAVLSAATGAELKFVASENQSASNHGMRAEIYTTPNGSTTEGLAATFGQDKSLTVVGAVSGSNLSGTNTGDQLFANYLPFGVYANISPFSGDAYPYSATIDRNMDFVKWSQGVFVVTTNNGSNYWNIRLINRGTGATIATLNTSAGAPDTALLLTASALGSFTTSANSVYMYCFKTGSPGLIYVFGPTLEVKIT